MHQGRQEASTPSHEPRAGHQSKCACALKRDIAFCLECATAISSRGQNEIDWSIRAHHLPFQCADQAAGGSHLSDGPCSRRSTWNRSHHWVNCGARYRQSHRSCVQGAGARIAITPSLFLTRPHQSSRKNACCSDGLRAHRDARLKHSAASSTRCARALISPRAAQ